MSTSTPTRTAGAAARRSSTTRSRAGTCAPRSAATSCSPPTRRSTGTRSTSSTGASASGSRTTSTGRCRASATGARRCRSGAATRGTSVCIGSLAELRRAAAATSPDDLHRPYIDEVGPALRGLRRRDAPRARADRRLVGLRLHAVRAVARAVRERGAVRASASRRTTSARRSTRRAAGSTRCSACRRCCSAARRTRPALPRPDPRSRGPEDVEVAAATWWCRGTCSTTHGADAFRWYYFTSKQPWDGYRFSLETVGESVRQFLKPLWNTYGFYVLYANVERRRADATGVDLTDLDRWVLSRLARDDRARDRAHGGLRHDVRRPRDRRVRRRPVELVRAPLAPALLGRRPGGVRDAARVPASTVVEAARAADAVHRRRDLREPRRLRAVGAPVRLPGAGPRATRSSSGRCRSRATRSSSAAPRARTAKLKVRQPLREAVVVAADREREAIERFERLAARGAERQVDPLRVRGRRARPLRAEAELPLARPALRQADAAGGRGGRGARPARGCDAARRRQRGHQHRRRGAPARGRRRADGAAAARGLPGRARRHARGRAQPRARRRAAPRGAGPRGRARGPGGAQGRRG